jgi:hypothetical protein
MILELNEPEIFELLNLSTETIEGNLSVLAAHPRVGDIPAQVRRAGTSTASSASSAGATEVARSELFFPWFEWRL